MGERLWRIRKIKRRNINGESDIPEHIREIIKKNIKELNPEKVCRYYFKGDPKKAEHRQECTFPSVYRRSWTSFDIQPGQQGLDATLGYGGHTSKMLEKLQERAISTDWM